MVSLVCVIYIILSSSRCGGGFGIALWILESYVVLLNATDIHRVRGCTVNPPYVDEYGELDPGLRYENEHTNACVCVCLWNGLSQCFFFL